MLKANIYVTLKQGVLDPQGEAVKNSLHVLNYPYVEEVRIGKFIEVWLKSADREAALKDLAELRVELMDHPIIEDYRVEVLEVK